MINQIPYGKQSINNHDIQAVVKSLKSDWLTQGPTIEAFEKAIAGYVGAKYAVSFNNGTSALLAACFASGIKNGDEVITSPYTFAATANSFVWFGARPVFVDVLDNTFRIDPSKIERAISNKTRAIIGVDFSGLPCDWEPIINIAKRHKLITIDDAAHSLGASYRGKKIGSIADMSCYSFHPIKTITTGEGGAVTTNNPILYEKLKIFRTHGIEKNIKKLLKKDGSWYYELQELGLNLRLTDFQAALGISQMGRIDNFINKRKIIVDFYSKHFSDLPVLLPYDSDDSKSAWHLYPIRLHLDELKTDRKKIFEELQRASLGVQVHYIPLHLHPYYKHRFGFKRGDFPNAERAYEEEISLPIFPSMSRAEMNRVVSIVRHVILKYRKKDNGKVLNLFKKVESESDPPIKADYDAVVLLTGESLDENYKGNLHDTEERLAHAIEIYKKINRVGGLPVFVVNGTRSQNKILLKIIGEAGIRKTMVLRNPNYPKASTDTQLRLLANCSFKNVALVTHAYHGPRVELTAKKALKNVHFGFFLTSRNNMDKKDLKMEMSKIQKYF